MNPFTQSTVARPLPESHPDRHWPSQPATHHAKPCLSSDLPTAPGLDTPRQRPATPVPETPCQRSAVSVPDTLCQRATVPKTRIKFPAVIALGVWVIGSAVAAIPSSPVLVAGAAAVAAVMVPGPAQAVDLNSASVQQLQAVKGIGPKTAQMIVDERTRGGNFLSLTDLSERVRGIGPKKAAALQTAGLKVGSAGGKGGGKVPPGAVKTGRP